MWPVGYDSERPSARDEPVGSTAASHARVGDLVAGKYRLNRLIGVGSIGAVYAAVHQFTGKHVALKVIDASVAESAGYAARFLREARAAADIGHPAICDVLDAGQEADGSLYLALELLEGRTLEQAIDAEDLRLDEIVEAGIQLLEGLAAAHDRGIVHRDIKPENVFLTWDERGELHLKLLDFGVAKRTREGPEVFQTQQGAILGTPYYMAPEQAAGDPVDARADIWSVGAVLFHALTGRPPFNEDTYNRLIARLLSHDPPSLRGARQDLPDWLYLAVDGALQRDADARWQSARTMAETLRRRGRAPIEVGWELRGDHTVRTESAFDAGEDERPALRALGVGPMVPASEMASIEVDLEQIEVDVFSQGERPEGEGGPTVGPPLRSSASPEPATPALRTVFPRTLFPRTEPGGYTAWLFVALIGVVVLVLLAITGRLLHEAVFEEDSATLPVEDLGSSP